MNPDSNKVGVLITTIADDGGIKTTQAELTMLGETAKKSSATSATAFESFNQSLGKIGTQMSAVGRSMTAGLTVPIVGIGGTAVKMAMDFQQAMTYVRTDAGDTTDNISKLSDQVLQLDKNGSQFDQTTLANGLYHIASLGLRGADAMNALNTAQKMASVGGADLESTASALGGAIVSGIKGVQDYNSAAGVLDATIGAGNMRMQDLVNAIGTGVLPVFKNAGLSITDFGAALATLTDNGQSADAAATHLRMTVSLMEAPSKAAASAMANIGLTSSQLGMDMQTKGLVPALQDLQKHLLDTYGTTDAGKQRMDAALNQMFGGGKSSAAIQTLLDQLDRVQNKETQITSQTGEFSQKYKEQQQTAAYQVAASWNSVKASLTQMGDAILPSVAKVMKTFAGVVSGVAGWFNHLSKGQQQFVIDAAAIVAAVGPILLIFGSFAKSINEMLTLGNTLAPLFIKAFGAIETQAVGMQASVAASGASMAGVLAGVAVDAYLVVKAFQAIQGAIKDTNAANSAESNATDQAGAIKDLEDRYKAGSITKTQETNGINALLSGVDSVHAHAAGTSYAPGGRTLLGEQGAEVVDLPRGSRVYPARQSSSMMGSNDKHYHFEGSTFSFGDAGGVKQFFNQINRDTLLASKGLTVRQGN